jgi:hypothetical protein
VEFRAGLKMFAENLLRLGLEIRSAQPADYKLYATSVESTEQRSKLSLRCEHDTNKQSGI